MKKKMMKIILNQIIERIQVQWTKEDTLEENYHNNNSLKKEAEKKLDKFYAT